MSQDRGLNVLAFAGSLRRGSYNRALLRAAQEVAPENMTISIFDIGEIRGQSQLRQAFEFTNSYCMPQQRFQS